MEPGFHKKNAIETLHKRMHEIGFQMLKAKKGSYVNGHECQDVIESQKKLSSKVLVLGFLNKVDPCLSEPLWPTANKLLFGEAKCSNK